MKCRTIGVMLLAIILSDVVHAGLLIETSRHQMYFDKGKFAAIANGKTDVYIDGRLCTLFHHPNRSLTRDGCETVWKNFERTRDEMMKKHGMTEADLSKHMPKGSSKVRQIGSRTIAGYASLCYELGHYGEKIVCLSKKVYELIKATTGMNPQEWAKKFRMDGMPGKNLTDQALAKLERNAFLMYQADILSTMGMNSFFFDSLPEAKKAEMIKQARADMEQNGGPPPQMEVVSVKKKSMKINLHTSYKKLAPQEFIASSMGGGPGGDMGTVGMPTAPGSDVNLEELMEQYGGANTQAMPTTKDKNKKDKKKLSLKERMKAIKNKLKLNKQSAE